jgi:NodT family efflux transporter outer membrane factor (OMF) lipoprotein
LFLFFKKEILPSLALAAAGCTVGPSYHPQRPQMPPRFSESAPNEAASHLAAHWWTMFQDSELNALVEQALRQSPDIVSAEAHVREARALAGIAGALTQPSVTADGAYARTHGSDRVPIGVPPGGLGPGIDSNYWQAGFDASWEIDIFGGQWRRVESAAAGYAAAVNTRDDVALSVAAEVARAYVDLRGAQRRLAVARQNLALQADTLELTRSLLAAGLAPVLDSLQAQAEVAQTKASIATIEGEARNDLYRIGVLAGRPPESLLTELEQPQPIPHAANSIPVGLPSELLRRRPDIRAADRRIAAANAKIGVATADLYPHFFLTGQAGLESLNTGTFINPSAGYFAVGPTMSWLIFDAGRVRFSIEAEAARTGEATAAYEHTVLSALQEVEGALVNVAKTEERRRHLEEERSADDQAVVVARRLYQQGLEDFLRVLVAETSLAATEEMLAAAEAEAANARISLCKALGGGWDTTSF